MIQKHSINPIILDLIEEIKKVDVMISKHLDNPSSFMKEQYQYKKDKLVNELILKLETKMSKKGYIILEVGWEYDDETYSTGETYEAPEEVFLDKKIAEQKFLKKEIEAYRTHELYVYMHDVNDYLQKNVTTEELDNYTKKVFGCTISDDLSNLMIEDKHTDEEITGLINLLNFRFNKLHQITIN